MAGFIEKIGGYILWLVFDGATGKVLSVALAYFYAAPLVVVPSTAIRIKKCRNRDSHAHLSNTSPKFPPGF
jgi:hypothetical protein